MQIERPTTYYESFLPTPRHRDLHWREVTGTVTAEIREVSGVEAPIALLRTRNGRKHLFAIQSNRGKPNRVEYHWFEGRFYTTIRRAKFQCYSDAESHIGRQPARPSDIYWSYHGVVRAGLDTRQQHFNEAMAEYLIIDGKLCAAIGEPRYVIMTFGLGGNHASTALMVDHGFNPNISTEAYFRVDEEAEAREAAMCVAGGRRDTKSVPRIRRRDYDRFEILVPEAVTMDRETRSGPVDSFSAHATAITNSGMPPELASLALFAAVMR